MPLINIIALLCLGVVFILQITNIVSLDMNILGPSSTLIAGLIISFTGVFDKNRRIKPKLKIDEPKFLNRVQTSVENSTIGINVANIGTSKVYLKQLIVLTKQPRKYLPFIKKRVKKEIIGHRGVSLEPNTPIEPNSDTSFHFGLAYLYNQDSNNQDGKFVKFGVKTSTGEIFWINKRQFNKMVREHITQYHDTINTTFMSLFQKCPDTDIESDIVGKLKSMADGSWDIGVIFQKTKEIFDTYQIYNIQWIGAIRDIDAIEVRKLRQIHLGHGCFLRDIYTKLDESISSLFKSVVVRTYNELKDSNRIAVDVDEDQELNDLGIPYKIEHGDYKSIFDELEFYLKPDEHLSDKQSGLWLTFGNILRVQYYFPSAVKCYEKSIELGNDTALLHLATTLNIYCDTIDEIVSLCTRYIDKNPDDYMGYYLLATSYLKQCKRNNDNTYLSECFENINKALKKSPDKPEVYDLSSQYYTHIGNDELAKKQREKKEDLEKNE